jgi:hypothetical protein
MGRGSRVGSDLSPEEFVKLVDEYGIKPSDLGISPNYLYMIRKGYRKPSRELVKRLLELIEGKGAEGVAPSAVGVVDRPGFEPGTSRMPTERSSRLSYRPTKTLR